MESQSTIDISKLKDLNTKVFDLQTRSLLCDSIIQELESKIASSREQIESMQTLNSEMKERQADLDLAIKGKLATYDQLLTTKIQMEFSAAFSNDDASSHGDHRGATKHLYFLNEIAKNFQQAHEENGLVQEINNVRLKIVRSEREVQKYDESLSKLQSEQNHEFQAIVDRRNKCIVSLVLVWKERQVIEARENQNNLKLKQLVAENKELKTKIENLEREEMNLWRTEAKGNEILPILTDIPELRYESATASTTNQQSSPATKSHAPSSTSSQEKTFEVVEKSPKKRKLDTRKSTPANKENIATTIQRTSTTACKKLPTTPPMVIKTRSMCSGKTPPQTKPAKTPEAAKETQKEENSADMVVEKSPPIPDVIDSTPNSPVKTAKDQDQTIMDLDEEFEAFDSVASSAGEPGSPGEVDDVNGSFFGGGPSADGDNWF